MHQGHPRALSAPLCLHHSALAAPAPPGPAQSALLTAWPPPALCQGPKALPLQPVQLEGIRAGFSCVRIAHPFLCSRVLSPSGNLQGKASRACAANCMARSLHAPRWAQRCDVICLHIALNPSPCCGTGEDMQQEAIDCATQVSCSHRRGCWPTRSSQMVQSTCLLWELSWAQWWS